MPINSNGTINCLHFINGQFVESDNKRTFDNINPATEEVIGTVAEGGKKKSTMPFPLPKGL